MLSIRENRGKLASICPPVLPATRPHARLICLAHHLAEKVVEKLTAAILDLVDLYCATFNANFHTAPHSHPGAAPVQEAGHAAAVLSFNVYGAHRVPVTWAAR